MQIRSGPHFLAGQSVSEVMAIDMLVPNVILTPADWTTPANVRMLYSCDNANFYPLYIANKRWEMLCIPGSAIKLIMTDWPTGSFIKFESIFGDDYITQTEDRWFQIVAS